MNEHESPRLSATQTAIACGVLVAGAVLFSMKAIFVKLALPYGVEPVPLLMLRMLFAMPFYVLVLVWLSRNGRRDLRHGRVPWLRISLLGFIGYYLASFFDFYGLKFISASLERVILYAYPTFVLLISAIFVGKRISGHQIIAITICYVGIFIAVKFGKAESADSNVPLGVSLILLSALTYAVYLVGSGELIPRLGVWKFTSIAMLVSTGCVMLHCWLTVPLESLLNYPRPVYLYGIAMAVFSTVVPSFLISEGIKRIGASNAAVIGGVGPISTIILAAIFLGESFTSAQFVGTILVIAGVIHISVNMKRS